MVRIHGNVLDFTSTAMLQMASWYFLVLIIDTYQAFLVYVDQSNPWIKKLTRLDFRLFSTGAANFQIWTVIVSSEIGPFRVRTHNSFGLRHWHENEIQSQNFLIESPVKFVSL